jgi:hypothetical protein
MGSGSRRPKTYRGLLDPRNGNVGAMSEAFTPEEETIETDLAETPPAEVPVDDEYHGPDPEDDPKGDGSDEDQGT